MSVPYYDKEVSEPSGFPTEIHNWFPEQGQGGTGKTTPGDTNMPP